jgi:hypothetical protein
MRSGPETTPRMLRYYTWAVTEKSLSRVPGGKSLYRRVGRVVKAKTQGTGPQLATSFPLARKAKELTPPGGTILDVGTGWFHHDAFLLYLIDDYTIYLFDIEDRGELEYIRNYITYLRDNIEWVSNELAIDAGRAHDKLTELLRLPDRTSIYERCNFIPCITDQLDRPFLPERSIDFMVSNCVLVHIRPHMLLPEMRTLRRMLKQGGAMYHMLGHDDHWAFHDPAMSWPSFNYLRYSERAYRVLFDTQLEYHNRIVRPEWLEIFSRSGLKVEEYEAVVNEQSHSNVRALARIAPRYARYSLDDLAIIYSYVLLRPQASDSSDTATRAPWRAREDVKDVARGARS